MNETAYPRVKALDHPLIVSINRLLRETVGIGMAIVLPGEEGWSCVFPPGTREVVPGFCRLVQGSADGAKHCRLCRVRMSIAACGRGIVEQRCLTGVSVLVVPVTHGGDPVTAILGTSMFLPGVRARAWKSVKARGKVLGVEIDALKAACDKLPALTAESAQIARGIMTVAAEAVRELSSHAMAEDGAGRGRLRGKRKVSQLVDTVVQLVSDKPDLPFSVSEIAGAARMTPNYFSMLFQKHMGRSFMDFLTEKRIELGKVLLRDRTLNIQEISVKCGYPDAGYFARRFRRMTGKTPTGWRESL